MRSFTTDHGGFNFNSLSKKDLPRFNSKFNSIQMENAMWTYYKKVFDNNHAKYEAWRAEKYEKWTDGPNGFKFPDVLYPQ